MYGETQFNFGNILHTIVGNVRNSKDLAIAESFFENVNLGMGSLLIF